MEIQMPQGVEGLSSLGSDVNHFEHNTGSVFSLPPQFDTKRFASKWAQEGHRTAEAQQDQVLLNANAKAAGWQIFKIENEAKTARLIEQHYDKALEEQETEYQRLLDLVSDKDKPKVKKPALKLPPPVMEAFTRPVSGRVWVLMFRPKNLQVAINKIYADTSRVLVNRTIDGDVSQDEGTLTSRDLKKVYQVESENAFPPPSAGGQPTRIDEAATNN